MCLMTSGLLFGCHGKIKLKKKTTMTTPPKPLSSRTNLVQMLIQNSEKFGRLPLGLVAVATESSHRLIMGKWANG